MKNKNAILFLVVELIYYTNELKTAKIKLKLKFKIIQVPNDMIMVSKQGQ